MKLSEVCYYVTDKIDCSSLNYLNYISTENMLQNCGGVSSSASIPNGNCISFKEGDILFSNIRPYFKKLWKAKCDGGCSSDVLCIRANSKINPVFLYYMLTQDAFISYVMKGTKGCKMPRGDKHFNMNWEFILPSVESQNNIATILSSLDDKIVNNSKICANLGAQAQALFKSWFVDFEPFKDGEFVESELGMIPKGWEVGTLGDITFQVLEKVNCRKDVRVLSAVNSGQLVLSDEFFLKQVYSKSIEKYIVVNPLDFAYNPARVNIGSIGMNEYNFCGCVSPVYVVFRCLKGYHYLMDMYRRRATFKSCVRKLAIGGVRQTLKYEDLARINCVIPPLSVVEQYNVFHNAIVSLSKQYTTETLNLVELRDTLLPKLMSGQIEL